MSLSDFLLSVSTTAFKPETIDRVESEYSVRADRGFWDRYQRQPVPKPIVEVPPCASFRIPESLLSEFIELTARVMIFGHKTTGFGETDSYRRAVSCRERGAGRLMLLRQLPLYGHVLCPLPSMLNDPATAFAEVARRITRAIGTVFDSGFLQGYGAGRPLGIVYAETTREVERGPILSDNVQRMREVFGEITKNDLWIASDSITFWPVSPEMRGPAPVVYTHEVPTLLSKNCLMLTDPSWYASGIRWEDAEVAVGVGADGLLFFFSITGDGRPMGERFVGLGAAR